MDPDRQRKNPGPKNPALAHARGVMKVVTYTRSVKAYANEINPLDGSHL